MKYPQQLAQKYNTLHTRHNLDLQLTKIKTYLELESRTPSMGGDFVYKNAVADFGSGAGRLAVPLANEGHSVYCVELNETMLLSMYMNNHMKDKEKIHAINDSFENFHKYPYIQQAATRGYFSYSLHQLVDKQKQIDLIKRIFDESNIKKLLIITSSYAQFDENYLNINCPELDKYDRDRYLDIDDFKKNFNVTKIDSETYYNKVSKDLLVKMLEEKYISSLHFISEESLNDLIEKTKNHPSEQILYPDFYTYILLEKF